MSGPVKATGSLLSKVAFGAAAASIPTAYAITNHEKISNVYHEAQKAHLGPFTPKEGETFYHGTKLNRSKPMQPGDQYRCPGNYYVSREIEGALQQAQDIGLNWRRQKIDGENIDDSPGVVYEVFPESYHKKLFTRVLYFKPDTQMTIVQTITDIPPASAWERRREAARREQF